MNKKGFSLAEVMIAIAILGLLAAIAIPSCQKVKKGVSESEIFWEKNYYNKADVELFCKEKNCEIGDFIKSEVLQNRYRNWLDEVENKRKGY